MQGEELSLIEVDLKLGLRGVRMLVNHDVLQHAVLVQDLFINFLVKEPHGVVRVLLKAIAVRGSLCDPSSIFVFEEDIT